MIRYPSRADIRAVTPSASEFQFPAELADELNRRFPDWEALHIALKANQQGVMWELLEEYYRRLSAITPQDIVDAADSHPNRLIPDVVNRAREAIAIKKLMADLEANYFPLRDVDRMLSYR